MDSKASQVLTHHFDGFTLDLARGALFAASGVELPLRPKSFALLQYLVENAGRLVDRDELMTAVWHGVYVTDDSITQCVKEVRRALGDAGQRLLRTVPRRGFLFEAQAPQREPPVLEEAPSVLPTTWRPIVVLLPFANMIADPEQEYFADGITADLTVALSHARWFSVIAHGSAYNYKNRVVDVRQVGRDLVAGYVLEGSVRGADGQVRITAQLSDAETGTQVWAGRFDGALAGVFAMQDGVTEEVANAIELSLWLAECERRRDRPVERCDAYDLCFKAPPHRFTSREGNNEGLRLLRRAVALEPGFAGAKGALAGLHMTRFSQGWAEEGDVEEAVRAAREVVEDAVSGVEPSTLALAAHTLAYLGKGYDAGLAAVDRALMLAPNSFTVMLSSALIQTYVGNSATAITQLERARRLSPVDPGMFYLAAALALAHFVAEDHEQAVEWARQAIHVRPAFLSAHRTLVSSLGQLGQWDAARAAVDALLASAAPGYTVTAAATHNGMRDPLLRERFLDGLRKAGLPP